MTTGRVSVKDVARLAGVSVGTVSNVLNRPDVVSEQTRQRVQRAIDDLRFVRNESARQLRAGRSRTIAYVVLDVSNPFFTDVASGIDEVAAANGLTLFLCSSAQSPAREQDHLDLLLEQRVLGLLITPVQQGGTQIAALRSAGVPVVLVDRAEGTDVCAVAVDDVEGGVLAVTHLAETGHERIAFIGGPLRIEQVADRRAGAQQAVLAAGLPADALTVLETSSLSVAEGRRAGERLLGLPAARRPTAAFCANDLVALGLLQQMTAHGVAVPGELAIVGYDDIEFAAAAAVPLTSVAQPRHLLGRTAAELLIEEAAADPAHEHRTVHFRPELVVRASTGLPVGRHQSAH